MPLDSGMISCIRHELSEKISYSKVERIYQPSKDEVVFALHKNGKRELLLLSCNSSFPRVCLTEDMIESMKTPPMFCMLLRKHFSGAVLKEIIQPDFERVLIFRFDSYDDFGEVSDKYIVLELIGKYTNIIIINGRNKIISSLRLVDLSLNEKRNIMPGIEYELPPKQNKLDPFSVSREQFISLCDGNREMTADRFLLYAFRGISPLVSREIVYRSAGKIDILISDIDHLSLWDSFSNMFARIKEDDFSPCLVFSKDSMIDYSFSDIIQYGKEYESRFFDSPSKMICMIYDKKTSELRIKQKESEMLKILNNARNRLTKKISTQCFELEECKDKEKYKLYGDLLISNIYMIEKGMSHIELDNYYSDPCVKVDIPLDTLLVPSANAQKYYKKYAKLKKAEVVLKDQITISENDIEYIDSVLDNLERCKSYDEIEEIRLELIKTGYIKSSDKKNNVRKSGMARPDRYITTGNKTVMCGRNNLQNDELTFKTAGKSDIWFHVKDFPGSHVILFTDGSEPSFEDIKEAANIAALNSKISDSSNVPVDYTEVRYVKKPSRSKPGYVIFTHNKTLYINPDESIVKKSES